MLTQTEMETIRKDNARYIRVLSRMLTRARTPRQCRSLEITVLRLAHVYSTVAKSFNKICHRTQKSGYLRKLENTRKILNNPNLPTCLSLLQVVSSHNIELDRWILAQAELVRIPHFTLFHCYGYNAMSRYESWESRQHKKVLKKIELAEQTSSKDDVIRKSILDSHLTALTWAGTLKDIQAPCLSVALWYLWPAVSVWYLLAHECFQQDILENGLCTSPVLVKRWKSFMRSPHVQQVCTSALHEAETTHGNLVW